MSKQLDFARELIDFIYDSPTAFHAVDNVKKTLLDCGFIELNEKDRWKLEKGGKYFVTKNDSAITAFIVGNGEISESGFKIIGAHTDSPSFRIKPAAEMTSENYYVRLNTEG